MGTSILGNPEPVGHVASSSESACGAIIGVVEAQVVDDVESHPWDETVLPVDVCLCCLLAWSISMMLDRSKSGGDLVVEFVSHGILDRKEPLVLSAVISGSLGKELVLILQHAGT
jgi:hypothetical protein